MSNQIIFYGHTTCPQVPPVRKLLEQAQVPFKYVNIHQDPTAAAHVRTINNGNESVPTLVFPDGSTLTEPSFGQLKEKLNALGYQVSFVPWLTHQWWLWFLLALLLLNLLRYMGLF